MNTIIEGLHTCKPKNAPSVGQVKAFVLEDRGDWLKLRNPDKKSGETGKLYRITKAAKTDYSDAHGNVSFNLELEQTDATPTAYQNAKQTMNQDAPQTNENAPRTSDSPGAEYWDNRNHRIERQHSQEMAMRYFDLCSHFTGAKLPTTQQMRDMISWFQRDISTSPEKPQPEAQPNDDDQPPF